MTPAQEKFSDMRRRQFTALVRLKDAAKSVVPLLKDHQLNNVAKSLEEEIFLVDAIEQEMVEFARHNLDAILAWVKPPVPE